MSPPGTAGTMKNPLKPPPSVLPPLPLCLPELVQSLLGLLGELRLRPPIQGDRAKSQQTGAQEKPQRAKQGIRARRFPVEKE